MDGSINWASCASYSNMGYMPYWSDWEEFWKTDFDADSREKFYTDPFYKWPLYWNSEQYLEKEDDDVYDDSTVDEGTDGDSLITT
jgi:hypothetical protein